MKLIKQENPRQPLRRQVVLLIAEQQVHTMERLVTKVIKDKLDIKDTITPAGVVISTLLALVVAGANKVTPTLNKAMDSSENNSDHTSINCFPGLLFFSSSCHLNFL